MSVKVKRYSLKAFDIHGHPEGTLPGIWKMFHKGIPSDICLKNFPETGLLGGIVSAIGDVNSFYPIKRNQTKSVFRQVKRIRKKIFENGYELITSPEQLSKVAKSDKTGFIIGVEGGDFLNGNLDILHELHDLGVVVITLVHFSNNLLGDVCMDLNGAEPATLKTNPRGLTSFGEDVIKEMNKLGMIVDVAHSSEKTAFEAIEVSKSPVMCSHTGPRAKQNFPRFISDGLMKKIASTGGIIGMWPSYFKGFGPKDTEEFGDFTRYVADLVGIDAIAIGTDFNGVPAYAKGYFGLRDFPVLGEVLLKKGFSLGDLQKIFFENFEKFYYNASSNISPHI